MGLDVLGGHLLTRNILERMSKLFYVYIVKCSDSTFYTGYTVDLNRRLETHNKGLGAKYTRGRRPVELVYQEICISKSEAIKREIDLKKMSRFEKLDLIKKINKV
jgi:putative endonuclease